MIYYIYVFNEDPNYKDVCLYAAVTDYTGETWSATISLDKNEGVVLDTLWRVSADQGDVFSGVEKDNVPRWFRVMADRMAPQIIAGHFQALIDEARAKEEANEPAV